MATQVQWKRGSTTQNNTYTGAIGEITVDTTLKQLRLHDGATAGGTIIGSTAITATTATNVAGGTAGQIPYQTAPGATSFFGAGTAGTVLVSYGSTGAPTFQNTLTLAGTTVSSSTQTGALVVGGGVGIGGNLYVGGDIIANKLTIQLTTVTTTLVQTDDVIQTLNTTQSSSTTTGALQVAGGAGIGLDITVGGSIRVGSVVTATTFVGNLTGNITGAGTGNLHYQSANNTTSFLSTGTTGQLLVAAGGAPVFTNTASISVGYSANILGVGTGGILYESANNVTSILSTGTVGQLLMSGVGAPVFTNTSSIYVNSARYADNLAAGATGSLVYQSAASTTAMLALGTSGYVLTAGASAPQWTPISNLSASTATNLANGTAGQLVYQTGPGATGFVNTATIGNFLQANYVGAPTWTTTASMYVANAVAATNLRAGTAGQIHYQSAADTSGFISTATSGNFLQANYVGAPTWTTTGSMQVGYSANILGAGTGNIVYQSGSNTTALLSTGTAGQLLMSAGGAPVFTNTSSIYVAAATQVNAVIQTSNATYYPIFVDSNNATAGAESVYTTSSFVINPATGFVGAGVTTPPGSLGNANLYALNGITAVGSATAQPYWHLYNPNAAANLKTWRIGLSDNTGAISFQTINDAYSASTEYLKINATGQVGVGSNYAGTGGALFAVNGGGYFNGILTATTIYGTFAGSIGGSVTINTATNIANGTAGQILYQSAPSTTAFVGTATSGNFLQANYVGAPTWTTTGSMQVGYSANILGAGTGNIHIQSANNTTALLSTGTTGQLLMSAGGAPVFTNTGSIYVAAATQVNTVIQTTNASYYPTFVDSNNAVSGAESVYTTSSFQINPSTGDTTLTGKFTVNNTAYNTATNTSNAIYTSGGIYADGGLTIGSNGPVLFKGPVTFAGTATYVLSTNTFYTDNIIEMHTPPGGVNAPWFLDDGKDIGFRFHYYTASTDTNAALVLANDTKYLEWYSAGAESTGSAFTSATYGVFKTGSIRLASGLVNSGNTNSGDLQVLGGVGIGGALYVGGNLTVAGTINATINGTITTATNVAGGTAGQIHYQTAPGLTGFAGPGTFGQFLMSTGASAPVYQSTLTQAAGNIIVTSNTPVSTTATGALQVINGGVGIGGGLVVGNITTITNTTNASSTTTGALQVVGGVGVGGNIYFNGNLYQNGTLFTSGSTSTTSTFTISNTTQSTSTTTGALVVAGGLGLGGNFYSGGTIVNLNGTNATSTATGALQIVNGGAGIGRDLWVGGAIYVAGSRVLPTSIQEFTATGGQTTFTVTGGYTVGTIQVFANGVQLANADFTASNGTTVVVTTPRVSGDIIRTVSGLTSSSVNNINALSLAYAVAFG